ncbi:MAG: hypothetical protein HY711_07395 [Candidatus Melainabacteria bacterium]|nr:hypothetical protein [Candidatus Melainabacteria bacterium]
MNEEPVEITFLVITALERLGIRYLIGGSLASAIYGEPRATRDVDILADIRPEHVQPLYEMLELQFNISTEAIQNALKHRSSFNAIHYQSLFKVDVFVPKNRQFDEQEFQRRALHVVAYAPERRAYVASAEDIILAKLDWYRQGNEGSEQQWRDVTGILKANMGRLDVQYMQATASDLGVLYLLQKLIPTA